MFQAKKKEAIPLIYGVFHKHTFIYDIYAVILLNFKIYKITIK